MNDTGQGGTSSEMFVRRCPSLLHVYTHRGHTWLLAGEKTGKTAVLWEPRLLLWILKREGARGRERSSYLDKTKLGLESPEHIISTALSLHTQATLEKWGGHWMGKEVIKKANFFEKRVCVLCVWVHMHACECLCAAVCLSDEYV